MINKEQLEKDIAETYTLGTYVFDEEKLCFFGDMEIELYLKEIEKDTYQSCDYYYCDGYECALTEEEIEFLVFKGSQKEVRQQSIKRFNSGANVFQGYPVIETNISICFEMFDGSNTYHDANGKIENDH